MPLAPPVMNAMEPRTDRELMKVIGNCLPSLSALNRQYADKGD
jgi:hypothetical protein